MAAKSERTAGKKKQPAAVETSESIAAQTAAFLAAGGEIERVDSGVSGNPSSYALRASHHQK
jgi:hypothetical protein